MLYVDYNFHITEKGLWMDDTHPDEMLKIERTPLKVGDTFVLVQMTEGQMFFRRTKQPVQESLDFSKPEPKSVLGWTD